MRKNFYNWFIMLGIMGLISHYAVAQAPPPSNFGQGFEKIAPKALPREDAPQADNPGGEVPEASGNSDPIVEKLGGLVFIAKPSEVKPDGIENPEVILGRNKVLIQGFTPPDEQGFRQIADGVVGKKASLLSLNEMLRDLVMHYRRNNHPIVDIYIPEQAMRNAVVQIVVTEGKIGQIRAEGNKYFSSDLLLADVRAKSGDPIDSYRMASDIAWVNNNPFRQVDLVYAKGEQEGTTDVVLKTSDRFPLRAYVGVDDTGNKLTQDLRDSFGFNYGNLFGMDQQFNYQYIGSPDFNELRAHSASYVIPLPWRHTLTVFGSYGDTIANFGSTSPLGSTGASWQASMRYNIPLDDIPIDEKLNFKHEVVLGYDYKESNSQLFSNGTLFNNTFTQTSQFMVGYNASIPDAFGGTTFTVSGFFSPGDMMSADNNEVYNTVGNGARATYIYGKYTIDRVTKLPENFTLATKALYQFSNSRLLGGEQLGLGGYATVRGYDEREANGDEGWLFSNEIRTPSISFGKGLGFEKPSDAAQFLIFCDYGVTTVHNGGDLPVVQSPPGANTALVGIGPGFRYNVSPWVSARFDYGWQLSNTDVPDTTRHHYNSRGHFSIVVSY